ncbi:MAG: PQQ-dependent sugar dehydrogenase [Anaerolineaceae bacterium]|nr:PQQ-dependent sugar dehydrogenase [Anaerolineaceae bacterium]
MRKKLFIVLIALFCLAVAASTAASNHEPVEDPIPAPIVEGSVQIQLQTVASGLTAPVWGTAVSNRCHGGLFVVDQDGILWHINTRSGDKTVFLDVSDRLVDLGAFGPGSFDERGFLGTAFHPDYEQNGLLYTYTSQPVDGPADFSTIPAGETANHQAVITEWQVPNPCHGTVDPGSARELLRIDEPQFNHNGGTVTFGPDGYLYISLGDGGNRDDEGIGHGPEGNGQNPGTILGSILRIDPQGSNSANGQYGIPADNPFVGQDGHVEEIYAYGFRNPYRFSFDSLTGALYAADVGQGDLEEVDLVSAGGNFGWNIKEGSFCFDPNGADPGFVFTCDTDHPDLIDPIAEYDHDEGVAVVGGFVYRGHRIADLHGRYVFGEFAQTFSNDGRLFYLDENNEILEFQIAGQDNLGMSLLGFGQDAQGELYVLANSTGTPFEDTGVVMRLVPDNRRRFRADLTGAEEVPPVDTDAEGIATFQTNAAETAVRYELRVRNIEDVLAAHIHCAPVGENGPVGVTLFSGGPVTVQGVLARGTITSPDPGNSCGWITVADVVAALRSGDTYVNVHTAAHPPGEIRGQIK